MTVDAREAMKERARELAAEIDARCMWGSEEYGLLYDDAEALILAALLEADREATERERERCATIHVSKAERLRRSNAKLLRDGFWPDTNGRLREAEWHEKFAASIRRKP
jgi:hypothetical protein